MREVIQIDYGRFLLIYLLLLIVLAVMKNVKCNNQNYYFWVVCK